MKVCALTDVGRVREMNQDYLYSSEEPVGQLPNLFLAADGMGGHRAGEFASGNAVARVVRSVMKSRKRDEISILQEAIQDANIYLKQYAEMHPAMKGMGTTMVAAVIHDDHMIVANVGDSRLYLVTPDNHTESSGITQITKDHSLVQELVRMGELNEEKAKNHPEKNMITRAVGVEDQLDIDFFEVDLPPASFVLLCTDGLSNMLDDQDIAHVIQGKGSVTDKAETLMKKAENNGGKDNITVILIETDRTDEVKA